MQRVLIWMALSHWQRRSTINSCIRHRRENGLFFLFSLMFKKYFQHFCRRVCFTYSGMNCTLFLYNSRSNLIHQRTMLTIWGCLVGCWCQEYTAAAPSVFSLVEWTADPLQYVWMEADSLCTQQSFPIICLPCYFRICSVPSASVSACITGLDVFACSKTILWGLVSLRMVPPAPPLPALFLWVRSK